MSGVRAARLQRVLDLRQRAADRIEVELAEWTRGVMAAQRALDAGRAAWLEAANAVVPSTCSSDDLGAAHAYAAVLGRRHEALTVALRETAKKREGCHLRLCAARIEVRKLEVWRARLLEVEGREAAASERRATDEFAARLARQA